MRRLAYWKAQFSREMSNSNKKRMRIIFISCGMFVLLFTTMILLFAFRSGIEFYKSPTQLLQVKDASIKLRVGGLVMKDSLKSTGVDNSFVITDGNNEVEVKFVGVLPDLFAEGRGVIVSIPISLPASLVHKILENFYEESPFIIIIPIEEVPATQHVRGSNFCHIGVVSDHNKNRSVVISVLDNLIKGSAGQAIQNANIMFDFDETSGLLESPIFP